MTRLGSPSILAVAARCPVGLTARQVALGFRADAFEPREHALRDREGRPIALCRLAGLPDDLHGPDRLIALAAPALAELAGARAWGALVPPAVVALPEPGRADDDPRLGVDLVAALAARSGAPLDLAQSAVVRGGRAGFAEALDHAIARLDAGAPAVVVGGVDSYLHPGVLSALDRGHRLHSLTSDDGLIPSEGAAFALLARAPLPRGAVPLAHLTHAASAPEPTVRTGEPNLSAALRGLVREAGRATATSGFRWALTDLNGERHRAREWSPIEMQAPLHRDLIHDRGPLRLGDLGAATGAVLAAIACEFFHLGCAPAPSALIALASDGPLRGVVVLEAAAS